MAAFLIGCSLTHVKAWTSASAELLPKGKPAKRLIIDTFYVLPWHGQHQHKRLELASHYRRGWPDSPESASNKRKYMQNLQPYLVFNAEATRINYLYWSTKYSYRRTLGMLRLISDTSQTLPDPRVDMLWKSNEIGESGTTTISLSAFTANLNENEKALRTTAILHVCSAFENALCGYFSLCALYAPLAEDPTCTSANVPALLKSPSDYTSRMSEILTSCEAKLHGKYTARLKTITETWGIPAINVPEVSRLNSHYKKRHLIAHDQGIDNADAPEKSAYELLTSRINIDEPTWKRMISDFNLVLLALDKAVLKHIVTDGGLALAIFRIVQRDGEQFLSELSEKLTKEWRMERVHKNRIKSSAISIGLKVKQAYANTYKVG